MEVINGLEDGGNGEIMDKVQTLSYKFWRPSVQPGDYS